MSRQRGNADGSVATLVQRRRGNKGRIALVSKPVKTSVAIVSNSRQPDRRCAKARSWRAAVPCAHDRRPGGGPGSWRCRRRAGSGPSGRGRDGYGPSGSVPASSGFFMFPDMARQKVRQSGMPTSGTGCASGSGGRGCASGVPAPSRTAGGSAAAPVDQEGGHGERHEDAPWAVPAMAGAVPEAAALPRPGARNVSFPVARLRRPHRMTDTPRPGRAGGRRPARTSGPSLSCRSPRIRACRSSGRSSRRRPAGRGPVRSGARCRSSRRASPMSPSSRWHRTSRTAARGRPASRPGRAEALLRSRSLTCGPPAAGPSPAPAALPCADAPGGGPRRAASRRSARSRSSSCRPRSGPAPGPAGTPRRGRDGRSPRPEPDGRRSSTRPAGPGASGACRRPCARNGGRSRPPGAETPAGRRPALEDLPALQGGVDAPGPQRRRPRGPAPSSRSRIRVSDGAFPTPKSARRFRARTGSSPPRTCRPDCRSDGIPGEKTASPDVRPTGRLKSRVTVGSGMRSKHARTARSTALASTDACERNLRTSAARLLPGRGKAGPAGKACDRKIRGCRATD